MASVLVETGEMLDAIKEKIGFTEMVCIPADVARVNGLRKKEYSVFYNKDYAGKDGDRPVFISLESSDGKVETNSLTWKLPMCIKVHNAILDVYNDIVFKKNLD